MSNVADYQARQKASKSFKENDSAKLQALTNKLAEEAASLGVSVDDIRTADDDKRAIWWGEIQQKTQQKITALDQELSRISPTDPRKSDLAKDKLKLQIKLKTAKGAEKKVSDLKKKIEREKDASTKEKKDKK